MWDTLDVAARRAMAAEQSVALRVKSAVDAVWIGAATLAVLIVLTAFQVVALSLVDLAILLAILLLMPLSVALLQQPRWRLAADWMLAAASRWQPAAALSAVIALLLPPGYRAAALATPWLLLTILIADAGLWSLLQGGWRRPHTLAACLGMMFVAIGGLWLVLWRFGAWPGGFEPIIAQLTVVHFHYAGLFLPLLFAATLSGSRLSSRMRIAANIVTLTFCASTLLLAIGITWSPPLELASAWLLAFAAGCVGVWQVIAAWNRAMENCSGRRGAGLLLISSASLLCGLGLAAIYAWGEFRGPPLLSIEQMIPTHGLLMSVGFALCGLLGWRKMTL